MKPRIYLAGGINGLSDEEVFGWRRYATAILDDLYVILDPSERDFRGIEATNVTEIVRGDLSEIGTADLLLVRAERPSWGTAMEVHYAHEHNIPVVVFGAGERPSPWLVYHSESQHETIYEAIDVCIDMHAALCEGIASDPMRVAT
jgi:nucleoside 2-deoxyribosyltransferase